MAKVIIGQAYEPKLPNKMDWDACLPRERKNKPRQPRLPNKMDWDACLIQTALTGRKRGWFTRLLEWLR